MTDNQNTIRDLAVYNSTANTTSVANHRVYNGFGALESQTNVAVDFLFGYTGRPLDYASGEQNNGERWYDAVTGRWLSEDPLGFAAGDANLGRYVGNGPTNASDPSGLLTDEQMIYRGLYDSQGNPRGASADSSGTGSNRGGTSGGGGYGVTDAYDQEDIDGNGPNERDPCYAVPGGKIGPPPAPVQQDTMPLYSIASYNGMPLDLGSGPFAVPSTAPPADENPSIPSMSADTRTDAERERSALASQSYDTSLPISQQCAATDALINLDWEMADVSPWYRAMVDLGRPHNYNYGMGDVTGLEQCAMLALGAAGLMQDGPVAPSATAPYNEGAAINTWEGEGGALPSGSQVPKFEPGFRPDGSYVRPDGTIQPPPVEMDYPPQPPLPGGGRFGPGPTPPPLPGGGRFGPGPLPNPRGPWWPPTGNQG